MKDFFLKLISDADGHISSNRFINLLIGVCSVGMMWKMVLMGQASEGVWGLWLAYGVGGAGWGKFVESKERTVTKTKVEYEAPDPSLRPPKG